MKNAINTTIDRAGRLVIPKAVREEAGLSPGDELVVRCRNGTVEIEPAPRELKLVRRGHVMVAEPVCHGGPLTTESVVRVRDRLRRGPERGKRG